MVASAKSLMCRVRAMTDSDSHQTIPSAAGSSLVRVRCRPILAFEEPVEHLKAKSPSSSAPIWMPSSALIRRNDVCICLKSQAPLKTGRG